MSLITRHLRANRHPGAGQTAVFRIMGSLSAYDDDAKNLFAGGLDDDEPLGMDDLEWWPTRFH